MTFVLLSADVIIADILGRSILEEANIDTFVQQLNQFLRAMLLRSFNRLRKALG